MRIFVTGATGYLGYHIACQCLIEGHQILCLRRSTSNSLFEPEIEKKIQWVTMNEDGWENIIITFSPDVLIHAAWGGVRGTERDDVFIQKQNIALSKYLFQIYPFKQIIAMGSQAEYGFYKEVVSEDYYSKPETEYAKAKLESLGFLKNYCEQNNIEWQWLRVFTVFGEKQTGGLIPLAISNCKNGVKSFDTTGGEQKYSYLYVKDFAKATCNVIGKTGKSGIYNVSQPAEVHSNKNILETINIMMQSNLQYNYGALSYAKNQIMLMSGKVDKFERAFGKIPHTDFEVAMKKTINSL